LLLCAILRRLYDTTALLQPRQDGVKPRVLQARKV
jgi:hypothetical protein